ncbi:unnamed protein product [Sphenostylis stenocarpa]|uniref:Protein kinase domain-containing protein n=1 Tax=Sphenostylis stenocarpa TaxID=92480 RepID=A0AA86SVV8_9FABA|nr:unnamed protein product [Sphenostylis stenocarpa]
MRHSMDDNPNLSLPRASSPSSSEFFKQVQPALKRHRPLGSTQSHSLRPKRSMVAQRNISNKSYEDPPSISDTCTDEGCKNKPSLQVESQSVGAHKKPQALTLSSDMKLDSSRLEKQEKNASCKRPSGPQKRTYDPEVHKVTDKALFEGVINGSFGNKTGRVKDDGFIYMVLEYGEIDLAHMLSQKLKELDGNNQTMDANWLRFYWQQILLAVNTIYEERIVHSDLKPANFLLIKGSLKLIDFGIAKAIMSNTTNIQRDSQVFYSCIHGYQSQVLVAGIRMMQF